MIYEESDGIYISKQNRKKNKKSRKGKKLKSEINKKNLGVKLS